MSNLDDYTTEELVARITETNVEVLTLKARISLRRESIMLQLIGQYSKRIRDSLDLEEAKFWNDMLVHETCFIDEAPKVKELQDALPEL
jgi:hypothetical protein